MGMTTSSPAYTALFAAAALSIALALPAQAETDRTASPALHVAYADLDLTDAHDARVMVQRLNAAADEVCGDKVMSPLLPRAAANHRACVADAVAAAAGQVNAPLLTAMVQGVEHNASVALAAR